MSIEQTLAALTAAIEANTAAILASSTNASAEAPAAAKEESKPAPRTRKAAPAAAKEDDAPKYTAEQVKAAAVKVKNEKGTKVAKALIAEHGAAELAKLKPENYEAFVLAAEALLAGEDDEAVDEDDGL